MPQCGLAPGAINIIASGLAHSFKVVRSVEMRVGALPLSAGNQMKYYLSWSTAASSMSIAIAARLFIRAGECQLYLWTVWNT